MTFHYFPSETFPKYHKKECSKYRGKPASHFLSMLEHHIKIQAVFDGFYQPSLRRNQWSFLPGLGLRGHGPQLPRCAFLGGARCHQQSQQLGQLGVRMRPP
jgi:hypothetical protein